MKRIFLLVAFLSFVNLATAQKPAFGLKGGLNIANISVSGDGSPDTKSFTSFHVGGFMEIMLNKKVSFQPELLYSQQGAKFDQLVDVEGTLYNTSNTFKFSYINIPLMIKYYPESKFFLEAGPQVGFLTSAKLNVEVSGFGSNEQDVKDFFKSVDFGLGIGAGYYFTKELSANVRYNFGLTNIAETEAGDNTEIKNNVFAISLGYKFK
ncbi:porin family protein [Flavobacterium sp. RSB2_4_14]|uniref:porin family protein n=1 Tax=Flavobacterium sp. RSB2_4_14 TaxID=3447665 RepID=UPI003F32CFEF